MLPLRRFGLGSHRVSWRAWLLAGVSVAAMLPQGAAARQLGAALMVPAPVAAANAAASAAQQAALIARQSQSALAAATRAIQAMQAVQTAARNAAQSGPNNLGADPNHPGSMLPNVPDGLVTGGLMPDSGVSAPGTANPVASWVNANTPTQTTSNGQTTVGIQQTAAQALLNWNTFNVGKNTTVIFDQQGNAGWVALNRITDPSGVPSQILGRIKADGTVLLINQNGIIFGGSSQINVHTLIASALDITLDNPTFVNNGLFSSAVPSGLTGSFAALFTNSSQGGGAVTVQPGAVIDTTANLNATGDGGYVALIGTATGGVSNAGTIATKNGQIILAADNSVDLITPTSTAIGVNTALQVIASGGPVTNAANGLLMSSDGAVTLAGGTINQLGGIVVSTSVTRPGSISLNTSVGVGTNPSSGDIVLGPTSLTAILPDETSGTLPTSTLNTTINDSNGKPIAYFAAALQPQIHITASGDVDIQGNGTGLGGAMIKAPSAALTIDAGAAQTAGTSGTILLEPGSNIDLSGLAGVTVPMSMNEISILITAAEVADDPLAAGLIGKTVIIDARLSGTRADGFQWVGSPILDAAGFAGLIPETIDQLLTAGGSFTSSAKNFIQQPGSAINVSGGFVQYAGGVINTTRLVGSDGRIYDIGKADPSVGYVGIAGQFTVQHRGSNGQIDPNLTQTWSGSLSQGHFEPGYIAGANGGAINVTALVPILDGDFVTDVVAGDRQRALAGSSNLASSDVMPSGASLSVTFATGGGAGSSNPYNVVLEPQGDAGPDPYGLIAGGFSFATASTWTPVLANGTFAMFSDRLTAASFGSISIKGAHELSMPAGATLSVRPGGSITLDGVATIDGTLNAAAGKISLTGFTYASGRAKPPTPALIIGPDAVLNVAGLWVNDFGATPDQIQGSSFVNGGSISIATIAASFGPNTGPGAFVDVTQSIILAPGSVIDVSGGGYVGTTGKLKTGADGLPIGKGGSLTLVTYLNGFGGAIASEGTNPINVVPQGTNPDGTVNQPNQANVLLDGTIYADGFDGGGTFSLQVPTIVIDGAATQVTSYFSNATASAIKGQAGAPAAFATSDANAGLTVLPPGFFDSGFSQFTLTDTFGGTTVTAGTKVVLRQTNALPTGRENQIPSGARVRDFAPIGLLPNGLRKPVSLTLNSQSSNGVLLASAASILADAQATVSLVATIGPTTVLGDIVAPAGTINVFGDTDVWLGANAMLDVSGTFVPNPQVTSYQTGTVLDGGTITLWAGNLTSGGTVVVQPGAQLDLQGAEVLADSNLIQLPQVGAGQPRALGQTAWSNGGTLQLNGDNIYFAGTVDAAGGAPQATGGSLAVGNITLPTAVVSSSFATFGTQKSLRSPGFIVVEPGGLVAANLPAVSPTAFPVTSTDLAADTPSQPGAFLGTDLLSGSSFDSVSLVANTIAFNGSVTVTLPGALTLTANGGFTTTANGNVNTRNFVLLPASGTLLPAGVTDPGTFVPPPCAPTATCIPSIGGTVVNLDAGYVGLVGSSDAGGNATTVFPSIADGTLNVNAQWIDLERVIVLSDVGNANFISSGAIRLLPSNDGFINGSTSATTFGGALIVPGNLTLQAAVIYPASNTEFLLLSTGTLASDNTLTIKPNGAPTAPLSAGGGLVLDAQNIVQDGTLWAPLGSIIIGLQNASQMPGVIASIVDSSPTYTGPLAVTQNVTLAAGSHTSVSAAGLDIPDGTTVDGTTWYLGAPNGSNPGTVLNTPPAKSIGIFSANINTAAGAVTDLSGGGDIFATEYVAGTGGTRNVLTTFEQNLVTGAFAPQYADGRQVYALVPTSLAKVAAYDPTFADNPYYSGLTVPANAVFGPAANNLPFKNAIAPGMSVTIGAGSSIPAGTYTLLPGMYATLPGAYRVVEAAGNINPAAVKGFTSADGSQYVAGTLSNALTGAHSSQTELFQLQSSAVWSKYSQITITSGTSFFRNQALAAGNAIPPLPIDGGVLTLGATTSLKLAGSFLFMPGTSDLAPGLQGAGGQVQISATNILILASDQAVPGADCTIGTGPGCTGSANYLVLDADQISNLGAASVLIGGTATFGTTGQTVTSVAINLEVDTDAAHQLTAPELTLVTLAAAPGTVGNTNGLTVDAGSVIRAVGTVPLGTSRNLTIGAGTAATASGSLLRVSNGTQVNISRPGATATGASFAIGTTPGSAVLAPGAGVSIDGGNWLTLDTSGNGTFSSGVALKASNYVLSANLIDIGGGTSGLVLNSSILANFADARSVTLRSSSFINLFDSDNLEIGQAANPIGTLILDAAGLFSQGTATTTIDALNVVLTDSQSTPNLTNAPTGTPTGTLVINAGLDGGSVFGAGTLTFGATPATSGSTPGFTFGFGAVDLAASQAIAFSGTGSFGAGSSNVSFSAPELLVNAGANESFTTSGNVTLATGIGTRPASVATNIGGALSISGASIMDSATIMALSGKVTLTATGTDSAACATCGDVILNPGAAIVATGSAVPVQDQTMFAPGGAVSLVSTNGSVNINTGLVDANGNPITAAVDVSAVGLGYSGSLSITAPGQVTFNGNLVGGAHFNDLGGNFSLTAGSVSGNLPFQSGFTGSFAATLASGDIIVPSNVTLTSGKVLLVANGGTVAVKGTIDASGPSGGQIALFGSGGDSGVLTNDGTMRVAGVLIDSSAQLIARYQADDPSDPANGNGTSADVQNGGIITLGTTGTPSRDINGNIVLNPDGSEAVASSGLIEVAAGAVFDISGGADGTGGQINVRAPILNVMMVDSHGNITGSTGDIASGTGTNVDGSAAFFWTGANVNFRGTVRGADTGGGVVLNAYKTWSAADGTSGFDGVIDPAGWYDKNGNMLPGSWANVLLLKLTPGSNYTSPPTVAISGTGWAGVTTQALMSATTGAGSVASSGSGFVNGTYTCSGTTCTSSTNTITLSVNGANGSGLAISTVTVAGGKVTAFNVSAGGTGYTSAVTVTFNGAGSAQATSANLKLTVTGLGVSTPAGSVLTGGVPTGVVFSGGGGTGAAVTLTAVTAAQAATETTLNGQSFEVAAGLVIPGSGIFTPTVANQAHVTFYQNTLVNFVEHPFMDTVNGDLTSSVASNDFASVGLNLLHLRPEISLVNPSASVNNGNIIVASNWNLGGVVTAPTASQNAPLTGYQPAYRTMGNTDAGEAGVLSLRAENNLQINATISDGFYETFDAFSKSASTSSSLVADMIANNPASAGSGINDVNTTAAASLMTSGPGNRGSFSYDFVAGAAFTATATPLANPDAVIAPPSSVVATAPIDSVTINNHTSYADTFTAAIGKIIDIPTLVRTGTGSIDITAAGNVEFLDTTAPGAVYTAEFSKPTPSGFTAPTIPSAYFTTPNGLVSLPTWASGGGAVTVTAGLSIIGIETPIDPGTFAAAEQFGVKNGPTGQFWASWYYHSGLSDGSATPFENCAVACQTAAWVNYATFFQAFGALGGGNITLTAGKDIDDVGASLPETVVVSNGTTAGGLPATANYFGGGNLRVTAGGNLNGSDFLVGRGTGLIQVGGSVQAETASNPNPVTGQVTAITQVTGTAVGATTPLPLLLAEQDGFIAVAARGSVTLGNIYDPASLTVAAAVQTPVQDLPGGSGNQNTRWSTYFTSYGADSGVSLTSTAGDVTALTVPSTAVFIEGLFLHTGSTSVLYSSNGGVKQSLIGLMLPATFDLSALSGNVTVNDTVNSNGTIVDVTDANLVPSPSLTGGDTGGIQIIAAQSVNLGDGLSMSDLLTTTTQFLGRSSQTLSNFISPLGSPLANLTVALHANDSTPVIIAAGQNINTGTLKLIKPAEIEAGNNINAGTFVGQNNNAGDITSIAAGNNLIGSSIDLYGPGTLLLQAGHDMGPFALSGGGIATLGNGSAIGNSLQLRPYLPPQGAEVDVLFGVKPGINYAAAVAQYVDPANAGTGGIDLLTDIASILGQPRDQAWISFQALSPARQHLLVDRAFLDFLTQVGQDYNNPSSLYFRQFGRAYTAISTLFPASDGYTDNSSGGGTSGAAVTVPTGKLNIAASVLETQMGGDINIIGPGGGITVGHTSRDTLNPSQEGILTLAGGTIRVYTDGSILLNQSRIMTEQGGDIDLFTANGNINAGSGPKTYASDPPINELCTVDGYCYVNPQGLVTGAGIAALATLPGFPGGGFDGEAPHGVIDAASASFRANHVNLVAAVILNAYNIQSNSTVTGVAFTPPPSVGVVPPPPPQPQQPVVPGLANHNDQSSVIIVEVIGYGGGGDQGNSPPNNSPPNNSDQKGNGDQNNGDDKRRRQPQP